MNTKLKLLSGKILLALGRFMTDTRLPVFILMLTLIYELFLLAVLFAPPGSGPWSRFALEFKVWCFNYNPNTGSMVWASAWIMLLEPLLITGILLVIWRKGLGSLFSRAGLRFHASSAVAGLLIGLLTLTAILSYGLPDETEEIPPFPGERIRTRLAPAGFSLSDHLGHPVNLESLRGEVVLITGVYSTCSVSCPFILIELRELLKELPEEAVKQLRVLALSLDPEGDTQERMQEITHAYDFNYPNFRFLNGEPGMMREILKSYQFSPVYNEDTEMIDHANLFILIDREGYIAYRFNLNPRHGSWMREAVLALLGESKIDHPVEVSGVIGQ